MKKMLLFSLVISIYACSTKTIPYQVAKISEWVMLFNGKNLSGWEKMGNFETDINDGVLQLNASHPYNNAWLLTSRSFQNFNLELEFMIEEGVNSGVLFRFNEVMKGVPNSTAFEVNIDLNPNIQGPLGTIEHAARAKLLENLNPGEWIRMKIQASGDHLKVFINDSLVCETHNRRSLAGKIGLQVPIKKGGAISFRNVKIQELADTDISGALLEEYYRTTFESPLEPMFEDESLEGWHTLGNGKWEFQEGRILHGYSGEAHSFLVTDKTYKNFYLKGKFKIIKEDNSGIFIRKHTDSTNVSLNDAIECNIYDHNGYAHAYSTGSLVTHARAWSFMIDYDDWNTMEIFAHENHIIMYINGQKSAEAYVPNAYNKPGNICLQAGTKVFTDNGPSNIYFKDLMIKNMDGL